MSVYIKKNCITLLIGVPGSGKSTTAHDLIKLNPNTVLHSSDDLRVELFGSRSVMNRNTELFSELHQRIITDLKRGINVIYDATNLNRKSRLYFINSLRQCQVEVNALIIATPKEKCFSQNMQRGAEEVVPEYVITRMLNNFQFPTYAEGFDNISIKYTNIDYIDKNYDLFKVVEDLTNYDQRNIFHDYTLGQHLRACSIAYYGKYPYAALLHDIGKPLCQSFKDGEDNAHYYGHENLSAYEAMFYLQYLNVDVNEIIEICQIIQNHMLPYVLTNSKLEDRLGKELASEVMKLHNADVKAH